MKRLFTLLITLLTTIPAWATHIRAGEISVRRLSCTELTFEVTFTGYEDTDSPVELGPGTIFFGDGTERFIDPPDLELIDSIVAPGVRMKQFVLIHTYEAVGTYIIRFQEFNRNEGVLNMTNSVNTPFYVETMISIDPFLGCNNTPVFLVPPIDRGARGIRFLHNPGAWDPDGDSLSYHLEVNQKDLATPVDNYQDPNQYDINTFGPNLATTQDDVSIPATYSIDPISGDLVWDAPYGEGEYNVAFSVVEWRKVSGQWWPLGYVVRDMQIIVEVTDNNPPELEIPADTCVEAGTLLTAEIFATDEDGDPVQIEAFGGIFAPTFPGAARINPGPSYRPVPTSTTFEWNTLCQHVRERPYEVQFRAKDRPGNFEVSLTDFKTWRIQVVAPAPTGLFAEVVQGTTTVLNWDEYDCGDAFQMEIYRRVDSYEFDPTGCNVGIPEEAGYELVGAVDIGETNFLDNNDGSGLAPGATYCYRLVAVYPEPTGGESYASAEVCVTIEADAPVITEVTVEATGETDGVIQVSWLLPFDLDTIPYNYELYRMTGLSGGAGRTLVASTSETVFRDSALNTLNIPYHYEVIAFDNGGITIDTSAVASSIELLPTPLFQSIEVAWEAEVPWSNNTQEYPYHYIYRNRTDAFQVDEMNFDLIDSVQVNDSGFVYLDEGQFNDILLEDTKEYCYYVVTQGSYGNEKTESLDPLQNASPIICARPNDTIPPCPVVELTVENPDGSFNCEAFMADKPCGFSDFSNTISWAYSEVPECQDEILGYNVYFSRTGESNTFELIAFTSENTFTHDDLPSFAGCYKVAAVDRSRNESELSDAICRENCPQYRLPDAFTINGDGINETLVALGDAYRLATGDNQCPRFVEEIKFTVFNRWGDRVYTYDTQNLEGAERTVFINWDGKATNGNQLSEGVYYYQVDVTYETLNPVQSVETLKGFIQIMR
ncbi:MAG TPA: hypothetical protein DCE41_11080 [Cytophagales bacterium]|nr:hypothetical protein [Cytophagales bacterium]